MIKLLAALMLSAWLLITPVWAQGELPRRPQIQCLGSEVFCAAIGEAQQRLRENSWTSWWAEYADNHHILVTEQKDWDERWLAWGAWPGVNQIGVATNAITGTAFDSVFLLHEIQHVADGQKCIYDPWAHERVMFWHTLAAYALGLPSPYIWLVFSQQTEFEHETDRYRALGLSEPCRTEDLGPAREEIAPWGLTYSQLHDALPWWP